MDSIYCPCSAKAWKYYSFSCVASRFLALRYVDRNSGIKHTFDELRTSTRLRLKYFKRINVNLLQTNEWKTHKLHNYKAKIAIKRPKETG